MTFLGTHLSTTPPQPWAQASALPRPIEKMQRWAQIGPSVPPPQGLESLGSRYSTNRPVLQVPTSNIFIVESDGYAQTTLHPLLTAGDHRVLTATTGAEALTQVAQENLHLIVLATHLIDMDGFEWCQQVRANRLYPRTPVIFTGSAERPDDRLDAFAVGGVDFVPQPFWPAEMIARIHSHLLMARWQHRIQRQTQQALTTQAPPLLASLQRTLHQQAQKLKAQNQQLQAEVQERQQVEQALRQEQQKSEKLLRNILPEAIADQLKQFQGSLAERFDDVTVLFADIVNFTPMAAEMSPLTLVDLLNQIFSAFDQVADKYQLEKIKTIGDAYMVVGGPPTPRSDHAYAVVEMAREMQQIMQGFTRSNGQPLQLRIGINTGNVVAGVIGIKKFSYDLWGDTVNVASRMESQGVPGKIQVTGATYDRLKDRYTFEPWGEVLVKGKGYSRFTT